MPELLCNLRADPLGDFLDPAKAQRFGIVVDAKFRGLITFSDNHMDPGHAISAGQFRDQSLRAGVCGIRGVGE